MELKPSAMCPEGLHLEKVVSVVKNKGYFRLHIGMLISFSNDSNIPITLVSCAMQDTDQARLDKFYSKLGFKDGIYAPMEKGKKRH
jgi:hypothetical protein